MVRKREGQGSERDWCNLYIILYLAHYPFPSLTEQPQAVRRHLPPRRKAKAMSEDFVDSDSLLDPLEDRIVHSSYIVRCCLLIRWIVELYFFLFLNKIYFGALCLPVWHPSLLSLRVPARARGWELSLCHQGARLVPLATSPLKRTGQLCRRCLMEIVTSWNMN